MCAVAPLRATMYFTSYVRARMRVYRARLRCVYFFCNFVSKAEKVNRIMQKRITKRVTQGGIFVADRGIFVTKRAIYVGNGPDADSRATQNADKM